jgi:hypothetical protein
MIMKKLSIICLLILFSFALQAEKHALIIAVGDYPIDGGWPSISSKNDISHIENALKILGFDPANISKVIDGEATREGILKAFESLTKKIKPGDNVFIHFSGHGQQVMDDNGDEIDQLDEAIVPYNSPVDYVEGFNEGQFLIRDDLISKLTNKIRKKCSASGQLILILDSCHSGTGTRGFGKSRGTTKVMAPSNFKKSDKKETTMGLVVENNDNLAPMSSFFGASAMELNYETSDDQSKPVGSLSFAIASTLANMKSKYSTQELFERIKLKMKTIAPRQNPQFEGPKDLIIFEGETSATDYLIDVEKTITPKDILISAGSMVGVYEGSAIDIISMDTDQVVGRGHVVKSTLTTSTVELDEPLTSKKDELIKAKIIDKAEPKIKCLINNQLPSDCQWSNIIDKVINTPIYESNDVNPNITISTSENKKDITIASSDGVILYQNTYNPAKEIRQFNELTNTFNKYNQAQFLRSYNIESNFDLKLEIIEVDCESPEKEKSLSAASEIELKLGHCIKFRVTNNGKKKSYFSLIDIQSDHTTNVVIPTTSLGYTAEEYFLAPGESFTTDFHLQIGEPIGLETLKLIASKNPLDLSSIIQDTGNATRGIGDLHPFEKMLMSSKSHSATRGIVIKKSNVSDIGVETLFFEIVE